MAAAATSYGANLDDAGTWRAFHAFQQELLLLRLQTGDQFQRLTTLMEAQRSHMGARLDRLEQRPSRELGPKLPPPPVPPSLQAPVPPASFGSKPPPLLQPPPAAKRSAPSGKPPPSFKPPPATAFVPPLRSPPRRQAQAGEEAQLLLESLRQAEWALTESWQQAQEAEAEALAAEEHAAQLRRRAQHQQHRAEAFEVHAAFLREGLQRLGDAQAISTPTEELPRSAECLELSLRLEAMQQAARALAAGQAAAEARAMVAEARVSAMETAMAEARALAAEAAAAEAQRANERVLQAEAESASLRATLQGVREVFVCPVRHGLCRSPVVASDGHTYDKRSMERWLRRQRTSPMTRELLRAQLFPNRAAMAVLQQLTEVGLGASDSDAEEEPESPMAAAPPEEDDEELRWRGLFGEALTAARPRTAAATRFGIFDEEVEEDVPMLDVFGDGAPVLPEFPPPAPVPDRVELQNAFWVGVGAERLATTPPGWYVPPHLRPGHRVQEEEDVPTLYLWDDGPPVFPEVSSDAEEVEDPAARDWDGWATWARQGALDW